MFASSIISSLQESPVQSDTNLHQTSNDNGFKQLGTISCATCGGCGKNYPGTSSRLQRFPKLKGPSIKDASGQRVSLYKHHVGLSWLDFRRKQEELSLCQQVFFNNIDRVGEFIVQGVCVNCYDLQNRRPLHLASSKGYYDMVKLLLDNGADPNATDGLGNTPLHLAICTNNVDIVLLLLRSGTNVDTIDLRGRSPLQLAQSKLKILQRSFDTEVKYKVTMIIDMLLIYLQKKNITSIHQASNVEDLLNGFHDRLQISETREQVSNEIDSLSKVLQQMETLAISETSEHNITATSNSTTKSQEP